MPSIRHTSPSFHAADSAVLFLLKHEPTEEVVLIASEMLRKKEWASVHGPICQGMFEIRRTEEWVATGKRRAENCLVAKLRRPSNKLRMEYWNYFFDILAPHASTGSTDFLVEYLKDRKNSWRDDCALQTLIRIDRERAKQVVNELLDAEPGELYPVQFWEFNDKESATKKLCQRIKENPDSTVAVKALELLVEKRTDLKPLLTKMLLERIDTRNATSQSGQTQRDDAVWYFCHDMALLEKLKYPGTQKLWREELDKRSENSEILAMLWGASNISRESFLKWMNNELPGSVSLKEISKLNQTEECDWEEPANFALYAIAKSQAGALIEMDYIEESDDFSKLFMQFSSIGDKNFQMEAVVVNENVVSTLINGRVYQLTMPDTEYWLQDIGIAEISDFLNAIAKRIDHPKRFFVFEAYDYLWCHENVVVFADPKTMKALKSQFGISPVLGCEFYFEDEATIQKDLAVEQ